MTTERDAAPRLGNLLSSDPPCPSGVVTPSGLRTCDAKALRVRLSGRLDDYGITRVADATGFDRLGVPVHVAVKPRGRSLSTGSGKGTTADASWVSAVMEAAEQTVWERIDPSEILASAKTMRALGRDVVDGAALPRQLGGIWSDELPIRWRVGLDVVRGRDVWVPDAMVTLARADAAPFVPGTNGLSSGAHVLEAVLSGLLECVERDATFLHATAPSVGISDALPLLGVVAPSLARRIVEANVPLEVVDVTTDIGIPVVAAYLSDGEGESFGYFGGAGAATDVGTALVRAVTEAVQSRSLLLYGVRDDVSHSRRRAAVARTYERPPTPARPAAALADGGEPSTGSVLGDLECVLSRLVAAGFDQVVVVRHTLPEEPVQVVRVIVPGLEGCKVLAAQPGARAHRHALRHERSAA